MTQQDNHAPSRLKTPRELLADIFESGRRNVPLDFIPALASLAAELVECNEHETVYAFTAPSSTTHGDTVVGGGALASMLDIAMAMTVVSRLQPAYTFSTISLTVNMLAIGLEGRFIAKARIDRIGRQVAFAQATLYDSKGNRAVANATSSLAVRNTTTEVSVRPGSP